MSDTISERWRITFYGFLAILLLFPLEYLALRLIMFFFVGVHCDGFFFLKGGSGDSSSCFSASPFLSGIHSSFERGFERGGMEEEDGEERWGWVT